ncbi:hypothetical protein [Psychrobacter sp. Sarcosine-3u-12]|uniref:hypothetical protein n=1 Tax=Psychrobacter sp. Sarcosine-3u-12 TaxID=2058325 RepID=UPI000C32B8C5|nr:hypothetical protein [Psychrobacter sp. Sarcosine-3u-12]PKG35331.1 hypothetical protein CXF65_08680 [Psychrobacter sp. Sarcosine-3u-12]
MTKTQFRILGGIIILINLVIFGTYGIEGIPLLIGTLGVALLFEMVLVKKYATDRNKPSQP